MSPLINALVYMKYPADVGRKLSDPIDSHGDRNLRDRRLITSYLPVVVAWLPSRGSGASGEGAQKRKQLRPQVLFRAVIGDEASDNCMACARPESSAMATVVTRLPTK